MPGGFRQVGRLVRKEAEQLIVGYTFDLRANTLTPSAIPNPGAGRVHEFYAWRESSGSREPVVLRDPDQIASEESAEQEEEPSEN